MLVIRRHATGRLGNRRTPGAQAFKELGHQFPAIMAPLIYERDQYMVAVMRQLAGRCAATGICSWMTWLAETTIVWALLLGEQPWASNEAAVAGVQCITRRGGRGSWSPARHQVRSQ
jgi:hypothetical protein